MLDCHGKCGDRRHVKLTERGFGARRSLVPIFPQLLSTIAREYASRRVGRELPDVSARDTWP